MTTHHSGLGAFVAILLTIGGAPAYAQQPPATAILGASTVSDTSGKPLAVLGLTCKMNASVGPKVQGLVKNISNLRFGQIEIQAVFTDKRGNFVSSATMYLEFSPLLPGQSSTFDGYGDNNPVIAFVHIATGLLGGGLIPSAGANSAHCD